MFRLLAIEWLKLRRYRGFWVLLILFMALLFLTNFVMSHGFFINTRNDISLFTKSYSFPEVWDIVGFWVRALGGLIPVLLIISTTNEFQYRTHRQNIIDGWSRAEFFHAKWLLCLVVALAVALYSAALGVVFGLAHDPHPRVSAEHLDRLLYVFLLILNYTALAMTLSFFIKRGALTLILFLSFCYVLEVIAAKILNWKFGNALGDFLPLQCSAGLLTFPINEAFRRQVVNTASGPSNDILAVATVCWLIFYYLIGWWKLRRSDW